MKFEFEIIEADLQDRRVIVELDRMVKEKLTHLTEFGRSTTYDAIARLLSDIEWLENKWLFCQRERICNKLSEVLNVDRYKLNEQDPDE